ncbi:hypothetical protein [Microbacterium sp.]|uniref:hypothetical protein n=1 Tax=Microbacterium sp. TaxID=51671 RepID=UPI0037355261
MNGLTGSQTPTFEVVPISPDSSTAEEALELATIAGVTLLPWQAEQVSRILGLTGGGDYAATRYACAVPRQSGKGVVLEVVTLAKAVLLGERVLWTAHEVRTMQESFARFRSILDAVPAVAAMVSSVRTANGQERILFTNGAEVKFSARSKSATRGLGFRTIICDEAQELDYLTFGAMVPTLSGQGESRTQQILMGTPPYSKKGEVFTDMRAAAHTGGDPRLSWSEWSCEPYDAPDDRAVWARTNPSLGVIVMESKIADEWETLKARPDVFRRERLGEWGRSGGDPLALDEALWAEGSRALPDRDPGYDFTNGPVRVFGVDCTFDAEWTTVTEAVPLKGGKWGLRVLDAGPGLDWVADAIAKLKDKSPRMLVTFDPMRTGDLTADFNAAGIRDGSAHKRIVTATSRDLTLACDGLVRAVRERKLIHADPRLDAAAETATRSTFDDGRGWKLIGTGGSDVSPLIAGALALRVLQGVRPRRAGKREMVIL